MKVFAFLPDRAGRDEINNILAQRRFTRAEMMARTEPRIDSGTLDNWRRHGHFDPEFQVSVGDAKQIRTLLKHWDDDDKLGPNRHYTGGDILKLMLLNAVAQSGLPFALATGKINAVWIGEDGEEITKEYSGLVALVLSRAADVLTGRLGRHAVIGVSVDRNGKYQVRVGDIRELGKGGLRAPDGVGEWCAVIDMDKMIARLLRDLVGEEASK